MRRRRRARARAARVRAGDRPARPRGGCGPRAAAGRLARRRAARSPRRRAASYRPRLRSGSVTESIAPKPSRASRSGSGRAPPRSREGGPARRAPRRRSSRATARSAARISGRCASASATSASSAAARRGGGADGIARSSLDVRLSNARAPPARGRAPSAPGRRSRRCSPDVERGAGDPASRRRRASPPRSKRSSPTRSRTARDPRRAAAIAREESAEELAERNRLPDFEISLGRFVNYGQSDGFGAMASVTLPIRQSRKKYDAGVAEATRGWPPHASDQRRARGPHAARGPAGVSEARRRRSSSTSCSSARTSRRPSRRCASTEGAYETGQLGFLDLVDTLRRIESVHLEHIAAQGDFERAYAELERVVGAELPRAGDGRRRDAWRRRIALVASCCSPRSRAAASRTSAASARSRRIVACGGGDGGRRATTSARCIRRSSPTSPGPARSAR